MSTCRPIGMDVGPIPWTAVNEYTRRHRMTDDEMDELLFCIRELEHVQREHTAGKRKQRKAK